MNSGRGPGGYGSSTGRGDDGDGRSGDGKIQVGPAEPWGLLGRFGSVWRGNRGPIHQYHWRDVASAPTDNGKLRPPARF